MALFEATGKILHVGKAGGKSDFLDGAAAFQKQIFRVLHALVFRVFHHGDAVFALEMLRDRHGGAMQMPSDVGKGDFAEQMCSDVFLCLPRDGGRRFFKEIAARNLIRDQREDGVIRFKIRMGMVWHSGKRGEHFAVGKRGRDGRDAAHRFGIIAVHDTDRAKNVAEALLAARNGNV